MKRAVLICIVILGMIIIDAKISKGFFTEQVGDLLTVDLKDVALMEVLQELSHKNDITFKVPPSLAEEKVMVRFSRLKIDEGLAKILYRYNRIFIYREEITPSTQSSPTARLKEVRIYPFAHKDWTKGCLTIGPGRSAPVVQDTVMDAGKLKEKEKKAKEEGKKTVEDLLLDMKNSDKKVRIEAIKELAKSRDDRALHSLVLARKDKDAGVRGEAEKALKKVGESFKEDHELQLQADADEENSNSTEGEVSTLSLASSSGSGANVFLDNEVPVRGVQFTLQGAQPTEIRTTSRTEGFFTQFNKENGKVIMVSLSGNEIAPGEGPIAEIVNSGGDKASLSEIKIIEK